MEYIENPEKFNTCKPRHISRAVVCVVDRIKERTTHEFAAAVYAAGEAETREARAEAYAHVRSVARRLRLLDQAI